MTCLFKDPVSKHGHVLKSHELARQRREQGAQRGPSRRPRATLGVSSRWPCVLTVPSSAGFPRAPRNCSSRAHSQQARVTRWAPRLPQVLGAKPLCLHKQRHPGGFTTLRQIYGKHLGSGLPHLGADGAAPSWWHSASAWCFDFPPEGFCSCFPLGLQARDKPPHCCSSQSPDSRPASL